MTSQAAADDSGSATARKWLVWILRFEATILTLAFPAIFLTQDFMAATHARLGLGTFPDTPITEYFARSLSAMYAVRALFAWLASFDVERFRPLALLLGWTNVLLGLLLIGIDLAAGLPMSWVIGEGPGIVVIGFVLVWLVRRAMPTDRWKAARGSEGR